MKLMRFNSIGLLVAALWFTSCTSQQYEQQRQGMVTESRALELAKAEFAKTGRKVSDYAVTVETDSTGQKWIVWFDKKGPYAKPGSKHAVTVEKATGKAVFMPGE